ncbi:hypothetical protein RUND412_005743 [Rhizina undulata]
MEAYQELGYYKQAEALYRRLLVVREKFLGKDYLKTLGVVYGMASLFKRQGRYDEALKGYQRSLAGRDKALVKDHPDTLATVRGMASVFEKQGADADHDIDARGLRR